MADPDPYIAQNHHNGASSNSASISHDLMGHLTTEETSMAVKATYHEAGIFTNFNDSSKIAANETNGISSNSDTVLDTDSRSNSSGDTSSDSDDNKDDTVGHAAHEPITHNSPQLGMFSGHLEEVGGPLIPLTEASCKPTSFASLLDSPFAPSRESFSIKLSLEDEIAEVECLQEEKRRIKRLLKEAKERCRKTRERLDFSNETFKSLQDHTGISKELWQEYEAFCESLEPRFGNRGGWSVTCFADHRNSYVKYDSDLMLFSESAEMSLEDCNFRCEARTILSSPHQKTRPDCPNKEYVVDFWPIASPEPRTGTEKTWGEQFPSLYLLATRALYDLNRPDTQAASDLLRSLPDQKAPFSGGWQFEYQSEEKRANHPILSRRWMYRSAHRINSSGHHSHEAEEDPITDEDAASRTTDTEETATDEDSMTSTDLDGLMDLD